MPAYLYPAAVLVAVAVVVLLGWIAWLIFNWQVFKKSDHKVEAFDRVAQLAPAYLQPSVGTSVSKTADGETTGAKRLPPFRLGRRGRRRTIDDGRHR